MNEEFNPYAQQPSADNPYANPQNTEPLYRQYSQDTVPLNQQYSQDTVPLYRQYSQDTVPLNQQYQQYPQQPPQYNQYPQQPQYQQYQQSQPYQQPYPYQQQYYYNQRPQGNKSAGMAKAFSIVSFVTGCISILMVLIMAFTLFMSIGISTYINGISSWADEGVSGLSLRGVPTLSLPGMIFGIVALVKKTKLPVLAVMGVVFNGVLLLSTVLFSLTNI